MDILGPFGSLAFWVVWEGWCLGFITLTLLLIIISYLMWEAGIS